ncbi:MAG: bifunctional UDP-N-acetylglucosamine diphosphorylase/glucosamine-1-phosphate N-acetyltransferase GlmU [Chloroflexi bacterium]|nr:bifunctional UDP-N-acetylglucosamine diphosphorylase/glucosamine-1-phosphate N-acetyltransferase GlmU [Chloroflexota bacterium]
MTRVAAVILAAGQGTRMRSTTPKVLHPVAGVPMVQWSVRNAQALGAAPIVLVVGVGADAVRAAVGDQVLYAEQAEQRGTGHAALQARELLLGQTDSVVVLYGDMPNLAPETLQRLVDTHRAKRPAVTLISVLSDDSMGFGRVVRDAQGRARAIVEEAAATAEILALKELNCGIYCFDASWLWQRLPDVRPTPPKNELYLTDMVGLAVADGLPVEVVTIRDVAEVQGVNTRAHLARSERIMRARINETHMAAGVTLLDPATSYIDAGVRIGQDTTIEPNTHLRGDTVVGARCVIGPNTVVHNGRIGDRCRVVASVLEDATLEDDVHVGPFAHLRPGAYLEQGVHMGNFGEVKNARLGAGVRMGHVSYIGDAEVGAGANIGAGTVTCNYDGARKQRTTIGAGAFIGSGSMLVAPVSVGRDAVVGAGSVVTHDVDDDALAYGVPARQRRRRDKEAEDEDDPAD